MSMLDDFLTRVVKLKVIADDFGYCPRRDDGIIELLRHGVLYSTSLMVNGSFAKEAIRKAKDLGIRLGLHLNLTEGRPLSPANKVQTLLLNGTNFFGGKFYLREESKRGNVCEDEVYTEIVCQIKCFIEEIGEIPDYVDGHQHIHVASIVRPSFVRALMKFGITYTRLPIDINISKCDLMQEKKYNFLKTVCRDAAECKQLFLDNNLGFASYFIGMTTMGKDMSITEIENSLMTILSETRVMQTTSEIFIEFMVHPGYRSVQGIGGCGEGPDEFSCSEDREHELKILMSDDFSKLLRKLAVKCLTQGIDTSY